MLNIAVIEDNDRDAKILEQCLTRYATQNHLQFQVAHFSSALKFINAYKSNYDLIFMDIEMPLMSGMEAAKALRQIDRGVTLVFVTNMVQYAVEGYAVEAFDYILKPINDYAFDLKLKRILSHVGSQDQIYRSLGTLKSIGEQLPESFCAISRWHVINMQYVSSVIGDDVLVKEEKLHIGRSYKQQFLQAYAEYMVGGT